MTLAFNSTSRYLNNFLNIDYSYFERMVNQIYPPKIQLNTVNTSVTEATFLDGHHSISKDFDSSKIYDKRDDFDFYIVNFSLFSWRCSTLSFLRSVYLSAYKNCSSM